LAGKPEGEKQFGKPTYRCEAKVERILKQEVWTGFIWFRTGTSGGSCEHGNEPSGAIRGGEFLD